MIFSWLEFYLTLISDVYICLLDEMTDYFSSFLLDSAQSKSECDFHLRFFVCLFVCLNARVSQWRRVATHVYYDFVMIYDLWLLHIACIELTKYRIVRMPVYLTRCRLQGEDDAHQIIQSGIYHDDGEIFAYKVLEYE